MLLVAFALLSQIQGVDADARLAKAVSIEECAEPLSKVVVDIGKAIGVPLVAESRIRDELIILSTKSRPARETMRVLADHFGWRWAPEGAGFRIEPSEEWLRKARAGAAVELLPQVQAYRKSCLALAKDIETVTPKKMAEEVSKLLTEGANVSDDSAFMQRIARIDPFAPLACRAAAGLTDDQLITSFRRRIVMSTNPGPLEVAMPPSIRGGISRAIARQFELYDQIRKASPKEEGITPPYRASDVAEVRFTFERTGEIAVRQLSSTGAVLAESTSGPPAPEFVPPPPLLPEVERAIRALKPGAFPVTTGEEPLSGFGHLAKSIAQGLGEDVVGDAYDVYLNLVPTARRTVQPRQWLSRCQVSRADGWIRFRSKRWPTFRSQSIPRRVLATLRGQNPKSLGLDDRANFSGLLESPQYRSPLLGWTEESYAFYRFWATVPMEMRNTLRSGQSVPLGLLPTSVHEFLYLAGVNGGTASATGGFGDGAFEEPEFENPPAPEVAESEFQMDDEYAGLYPGGIALSASLSLRWTTLPGLYNSSWQTLLPPAFVVDDEMVDAMRASGAERDLQVATVTAMEFRFRLGPKLDVGHREVGYQLGQRISSDRETWPADLRKRIEFQRTRARERGTDEQRVDPPPPIAQNQDMSMLR